MEVEVEADDVVGDRVAIAKREEMVAVAMKDGSRPVEVMISWLEPIAVIELMLAMDMQLIGVVQALDN